MVIGCPKEIKKHEYRAGMTPSCVRSYRFHGHRVMVERGAGEGSGFADSEYSAAGADLTDAVGAWSADMVVKVKEPLAAEYGYFRKNLLVYTYLHLAADGSLTRALLESGVSAVGYETMRTADGHLPCLAPMSEIAGRLSVQEGAKYLERPFGGRGVLLSGVPGTERGRVAILGGGTVGLNACKIAAGMGAEVTVLDVNTARLGYLDDLFGGRITTLYSNDANVERVLGESDLVIGAVLVPGARAPKLVRREHLSLMKRGAVIVDVAVDQGGCFETTKATYHDDPVYTVDGVLHYCVANMPGAVPRTSTMALTNATLNPGLELADRGLAAACAVSPLLSGGLNAHAGHCTCKGVAEAFGLDYVSPEEALG